MKCIDLRRQFGQQFRVVEEDSGRRARKASDPWLFQIACQHGHIAPWGGDLLAACTDRRGPVANRLMALPGVQVAQLGDDGANVVFPAAMFEQVAEIMRPRRRRVMTPEQRAKAAATLAANRFDLSTVRKLRHNVQESHAAP